MPTEGYNLSTTLVQGYIPLDLQSARLFTAADGPGVVLSTATAPFIKPVSTGAISSGSIFNAGWSSAGVVPLAFASVVTPPDWSTVDGATVHLFGAKSSNTDAAFTAKVQCVTRGTVAVLSSAATGAWAVTTPADYTAKISSANLPAYPGVLQVIVTPGTHANDSILLFGAAISYGRARRG